MVLTQFRQCDLMESPRFLPPRKLGVGFPYLSNVPVEFYDRRDLLDFVEVTPELLCREVGHGEPMRLDFVPDQLEKALRATARLPVVVHGVELSIGSESGWSEAYIEVLDRFHRQQPFVWHSEHLGFMLAETPEGKTFNAGVPLPLPFTSAALDLIVPRALALGRRYDVPFLLENSVYYVPDLPADEGRDEVAFLNDLVERSGCGLLLDLFNFHANALHHGFDAWDALDRLRLDRVVEIHVAGGSSHDGFLLDSHSEVVPEPVWSLLEAVVPRAPHLAGIVFELLDEAFDNVGTEETCRQLRRVKQIWGRRDVSQERALGCR
jgi:uncharacterized protein (UPF0276 family)